MTLHRSIFSAACLLILASCGQPSTSAPALNETPPNGLAGAVPAGGTLSIADFAGRADVGERVYAQCRVCHQTEPGVHIVGPSLYGILGRTAGTVEGFRYSKANEESEIVWTDQTMFEYLENPMGYIPGTTMAFPGVRLEQDRADLIAYLKSVPLD